MTHSKRTKVRGFSELEELEKLLGNKEAQIEEVDFINPYEEGGIIWEEWTKEKFIKALRQAEQQGIKLAYEELVINRSPYLLHVKGNVWFEAWDLAEDVIKDLLKTKRQSRIPLRTKVLSTLRQ